MSSFPVEVKLEDQAEPVMLYTFAPEDPIDWNPDFSFNVPTSPIASSSHRETHIPIAKSTRRREQSPTFALPSVPLLESSSPTPHYTHVIRPSPLDGVSSQPRIPRPPNAFMLFRSDFLKRGVIPDNVERRQQNLSRIAGEMWNLLDPVEKEKWHGEAARALAEHQRKNPGYKFTPSPRGSRLARIKARGDVGGMGEDDIRRIRETYTNLTGPAPVSNRRRRQKKAKSVEAQSCTPGSPSLVQQPVLACYPLAQLETLLPRLPNPFMNPSPPPHRNPLQRSSPTFVSPFYSVDSFPRATLPRRPSTSLGFVEQPKESHFVERDGRVAGSVKASPSSPLPTRTNNFLTFVFDHGEVISAVSPSPSLPASTTTENHPSPSWEVSANHLYVDPQLTVASTPSPGFRAQTPPPLVRYPTPSAHYSPGGYVYSIVNDATNGDFLASLGMSGEMLECLQPGYGTPLFDPASSSSNLMHNVWLPVATDLEKWNLTPPDYFNTGSLTFAVGDYEAPK